MSTGAVTPAGKRAHARASATAAAPLRILAVGNMYPPHHAGGYELMWQAAMRHAGEQGHEVRVVTSDYRRSDAGEDGPNVHRVLEWYWDLERYEFPQLNVIERLRLERHNATELDRHLREFCPDIVSWWSMGCMSLSLIERVRRAGIPAVFVVHDDWLAYGPHRDQWLRIWRGRRTLLAPLAARACGLPTSLDLNRAGPFVFNSRYTLERAREAGIDAAEATVVAPGIDTRFLVELPMRPWRWRLLYMGRIDRQKGLDTAVRALAELPPEATLSIWGTGDESYISELRALAAATGVAERVHFHGWARPEQQLSAYADADLVAFPVRWNEPFGLVPLEAMGVGRPVVTTLRGGTTEFARDGQNALVFEADDHVGLVRAVRRLADDLELRARLREGGRRTAQEYTITRFAADTVDEIVQAAQGAPA